MIALHGIDVYYDELQVLQNIDIDIPAGKIVAILGANGAGKSTVMSTMSGLVRPRRGQVLLDGKPITGLSPRERVDLGLAHVPERQRVFPQLTVRENLVLGAYVARARKELNESLQRVYRLFPFLETRQKQRAGPLSGGEQQMLAIARGLMSMPRVLMMDEPFLGLSPAMVQQIIDVTRRLNDEGMTIVFIEQHVRQSLTLAHEGYVLESGRVALHGLSDELLSDDRVRYVYMGLEMPAKS